MPTSGITDALAELKRAQHLGLRSITLARFPHGGGTPSDEDDLFWETALEMGWPSPPTAAWADRTNPLLVGSATGTFDLKTAVVSRTFPARPMLIAGMIVERRVRAHPGPAHLPGRDQRRLDP